MDKIQINTPYLQFSHRNSYKFFAYMGAWPHRPLGSLTPPMDRKRRQKTTLWNLEILLDILLDNDMTFQRIRGFTMMRYINRLFTYFLTSLLCVIFSDVRGNNRQRTVLTMCDGQTAVHPSIIHPSIHLVIISHKLVIKTKQNSRTIDLCP